MNELHEALDNHHKMLEERTRAVVEAARAVVASMPARSLIFDVPWRYKLDALSAALAGEGE